jgi:hypothetical protein
MQRPALQVDFLVWLDRYVGTWEFDGQQYTIRRRNDGWLEAKGPDYEVASLSDLLAKGKRIKPAQSPLGMYPILISHPLMELWLKPDEMDRLRNAWRVRLGMQLIVEAIEQNVRESDAATRRAKFEQMWLLGRSYDEPWTDEDSEVYPWLLAKYEAARAVEEGPGPKSALRRRRGENNLH